ncbi:MAG: acyl-ACP--UDP-N-acetylglucosamine O-acyltransferase [Pseudomonadales bacterium]
MSGVDSRAAIDPTAKIADDVEIGPWTLIGPDVEIGPGCKIHSHVVVKGPTRIGSGNTIYQFSTVGEDTPDVKYKGEPTRLEIGDNNIIREGVTIHRGTIQDQSLTSIGDNNLIMAYVHIAHDCMVGSNTILVNNASLAGHVRVDDWAIISGYSLIHQYCIVGAHSYTGMASHVIKDIPAYMMVYGQPAEVRTINQEGLRRRDFSSETISVLKKAYKILYRRGHKLDEAIEQIRELASSEPALEPLLKSVENSERGITR